MRASAGFHHPSTVTQTALRKTTAAWGRPPSERSFGKTHHRIVCARMNLRQLARTKTISLRSYQQR
jgi:hypothetical protein